MTTQPRYQSATAVWAAARDHAQRTNNQTSALRQFVYDRFLARLFTNDDAPWLLKGGNALVSRNPQAARATTDIDLGGRTDSTITELQDALAAALAVDLADHFRFTIAATRPHAATPSQPNITGSTLTIQAWCGTRKATTFRVDLVAGSLITDQPETITRTPAISLDGYPPPKVLVYPVVDHLADKICATAQTYASAPSSRARDLVDLVVIATTQTFNSQRLRTAITLEWQHRNLAGTPTFNPPQDWEPTYRRLAKNTNACRDHQTFPQAVDLIQSRLLQPLWTHTTDHTWNPTTTIWTATPS